VVGAPLLRYPCTVNRTVITLYSFIQTFLSHTTLTLLHVLSLLHKEIHHTKGELSQTTCVKVPTLMIFQSGSVKAQQVINM